MHTKGIIIMPKTPPNDGTELTHVERLEMHNERLVMQNRALHAKLDNMPQILRYAGTPRTVVMHGDVESWLKCTNENYDIPMGILVNAIIRHHMWLDVDTGDMRTDLSGMMWWPNEREY